MTNRRRPNTMPRMLSRAAALSVLCIVLGSVPGLAATLVTDPQSNCSTSNPYPQGQESIRWTGGCRDGLLDGAGILTWYRDGRWTERNEGTFRAGELHGSAITTFPDGSTIAGTYVDGKRHGEFILSRTNDTYSRAFYRNDQLVEERPLTREQMRTLLAERRNQAPQPRPAPSAAPTVAYAPHASQAPAATPRPAPAAAQAPTQLAAASAPFPAPPPTVSSMAHARAVAPPWSPMANAAALTAYAPPAPAAPRATQPAVAQPVVAAPAPAPVYPTPVYPAAAPVAPAPVAAAAAPISNLPLPSARRVCTAPGLYPKGAGWCGVVRREQGDSIEVEVTNVRLNSLFAVGIAPGECTGNEFVGRSDEGKRIWVPARCMQ